jgi:hypothetical protein
MMVRRAFAWGGKREAKANFTGRRDSAIECEVGRIPQNLLKTMLAQVYLLPLRVVGPYSSTTAQIVSNALSLGHKLDTWSSRV